MRDRRSFIRRLTPLPTTDANASAILTPELLAARLDAWAFRREKVLFLVDHARARRARALMERCHELITLDFEPGTSATGRLALAWLEIREEAAHLLAEAAREERRNLAQSA